MSFSYTLTDPYGKIVDLATEPWVQGFVAEYVQELIPEWPLPGPADEGYGVLSMYSETASRWLVFRDEVWVKDNILSGIGTSKNYTDVEISNLRGYIDDRDQYIYDENHRYTDEKFSELNDMHFELFLSYIDRMDAN